MSEDKGDESYTKCEVTISMIRAVACLIAAAGFAALCLGILWMIRGA